MEAVASNVVRSKSKGRSTVGKKASARDLSTYSGRLGHAMRQRREAIGKTIEDVRAALETAGVPATASSIYHWESGRRPIPIEALPVVAKALRTSVKTLMPNE